MAAAKKGEEVALVVLSGDDGHGQTRGRLRFIQIETNKVQGKTEIDSNQNYQNPRPLLKVALG